MRQSTLLLTTLRESPSEAEVISHQLMLRAGFIRQLAAGIYTYLPLGRRVLRKVEQIVREEMDRTDAQEVLMPAMQPTELWSQSGRYSIYGPELIRLRDRHEREFALGPTHETMEPVESITAEMEKFQTPDLRTIDLVKSLGIKSTDIIKTIVYIVDGKAVALLVRGDHEVNEIKVKNYFGADNIEIAASQMVESVIGVPIGFIGPYGLTVSLIVDKAVANMKNGIVGANKLDYHFRNVRSGRDFKLDHVADLRNVIEGEACPRCHDGI